MRRQHRLKARTRKSWRLNKKCELLKKNYAITTPNPPFPQPLDGPGGYRYNLADVMAAVMGYEEAAYQLAMFANSPLVRPAINYTEYSYFYDEAERLLTLIRKG